MHRFITKHIANLVFAHLQTPKEAGAGQVQLKKFFLILGLLGFIGFLIPAVITAFSYEPLWLTVLFSAFSLLSLTFVIAYINCRVSYNEDGFVSRNFFGIKREYTYDQITSIEMSMQENTLHLGDSKVEISLFSAGWVDFISLAQRKYKTLHNGQTIPEYQGQKKDIFNGNIKDASGYLAAYIAIGVMLIGLLAFFVWHVFFPPSTADNTAEMQATFSSCIMEEHTLVLTASDDRIYQIGCINENFDTEKIQSLCDGKTVVTVYANEITSDTADDYFSIKAILDGDEYVLSFDETNRLIRKKNGLFFYFPVICAIVWAVYGAGAIIVGRNPKKYGKKVVSWFFKDGYIRD